MRLEGWALALGQICLRIASPRLMWVPASGHRSMPGLELRCPWKRLLPPQVDHHLQEEEQQQQLQLLENVQHTAREGYCVIWTTYLMLQDAFETRVSLLAPPRYRYHHWDGRIESSNCPSVSSVALHRTVHFMSPLG